LTAEQLGLSPILLEDGHAQEGVGAGHGPHRQRQSTTLAAMIDYANKHRKDHILTIEDPIEFVHERQGCLVTHREVGFHTKSFAAALRGALREDPDIILVGEMRDLETIRLAVEAAATGHLVFGTLHTTNAAKTVDRVIEVFPAEERPQIRNTLSTSLRVVVAQHLFKWVDVKGRCAALEILVCTAAVGNLIRDAKTFQIRFDDANRKEARHANPRRCDPGPPQQKVDRAGRSLRESRRQEPVHTVSEDTAGRPGLLRSRRRKAGESRGRTGCGHETHRGRPPPEPTPLAAGEGVGPSSLAHCSPEVGSSGRLSKRPLEPGLDRPAPVGDGTAPATIHLTWRHTVARAPRPGWSAPSCSRSFSSSDPSEQEDHQPARAGR